MQKMREEIRQLQAQLHSDHLTGLFNARYLSFTLEQEIERTHRTALPTTFVLLDIDHFKSVNDAYGHIVGDQMLVHLATIIKKTLRKLDVACRYGGDEFAVVLPSTPLLLGVRVAQRIRKKLAKTPLNHAGTPVFITVSGGIDSYVGHQHENMLQFIARTDMQLYSAKKGGRNRVCYNSANNNGKVAMSVNEAVEKPKF
jgi:diguanylate cyclase (GGDEF)-like protein